jgi:hypothetical protein
MTGQDIPPYALFKEGMRVFERFVLQAFLRGDEGVQKGLPRLQLSKET